MTTDCIEAITNIIVDVRITTTSVPIENAQNKNRDNVSWDMCLVGWGSWSQRCISQHLELVQFYNGGP